MITSSNFNMSLHVGPREGGGTENKKNKANHRPRKTCASGGARFFSPKGGKGSVRVAQTIRKMDHKMTPKSFKKRYHRQHKKKLEWSKTDFCWISTLPLRWKTIKTVIGLFEITLCVYATYNVNKHCLNMVWSEKIAQKWSQNRSKIHQSWTTFASTNKARRRRTRRRCLERGVCLQRTARRIRTPGSGVHGEG